MDSLTGCVYIVFTRVPVPGKVKTRLLSRLSGDDCALLQEAMILDLVEDLSRAGNPLSICCSDEWRCVEDGERLYSRFIESAREVCAAPCELHVFEQEGDDMGARMTRAVEAAFDSGAASCLLMGSDLPYIARENVYAAERALRGADVVFGPSRDKGYWLVGVKEPFRALFENKRFGEGPVLEQAIASCRACGKTVSLVCESPDIDTPEDYEALVAHVLDGDIRVGTRVAAVVGRLENGRKR